MAVSLACEKAVSINPTSEHVWGATVNQFDPWDVVVIGAGPAGAVAARQLALKGLHVLLVEKSHLPRFKVCGGCIGGAALDLLNHVGLGGLLTECGGVPLHTLRLAIGGSVAKINAGRRIAVSRQTFDTALVREAVKSGAILCTETVGDLRSVIEPATRSVVLRHRATTTLTRTRAVLIATGLAPSPPDFVDRASPRSRIGLGTLLENSAGYAEAGTLYMACGSEGYVGIAPVEGDRLEIAAAVDPKALATAASPGELVSHLLRNAGLSVPDQLRTTSWRGTPLLTRRTSPLGSSRCLVVGDAAEYVEPFTGEGIGWAMQSAVLASELIVNGLHHWDAQIPDRWAKLHKRTFGGHRRQCRFVVELLRHQATRNCLQWSLCWMPGLARPLVRQLDH